MQRTSCGMKAWNPCHTGGSKTACNQTSSSRKARHQGRKSGCCLSALSPNRGDVAPQAHCILWGVFWRLQHIDTQACDHPCSREALLSHSNSLDPSDYTITLFSAFSYFSSVHLIKGNFKGNSSMENRICRIAVEAKRGSPAFLWKPRDLRSTSESLRSFWVFQYIWQREICFGWVLRWDACGTALQTICAPAAVL